MDESETDQIRCYMMCTHIRIQLGAAAAMKVRYIILTIVMIASVAS